MQIEDSGSQTVFVDTESHKVFHRVKRVFPSCDSVKNSEKLCDHKICQRTKILNRVGVMIIKIVLGFNKRANKFYENQTVNLSIN
jgi:hypothetical protein